MNEKLLIVDDEKGVVDMLKSYFEMQSFVVYTAYDGETALKQAAFHPDLVLLDINMPGIAVLSLETERAACYSHGWSKPHDGE